MKKVQCKKIGIEAEGLAVSPYPGTLGERILQSISKQAWGMWLSHQTMLINEYRLNLLEIKSREFLEKEMEKFLFAEGSDKPAGFIPQEK